MDLLKWKKPDNAYRSAPFWSWNGEMKPEIAVDQVRSMHDAGMGGFYMHSRSGLKTRYMGKEWMDCVAACVEEAVRLGMKANLYDEDKYCSGNAAGWISKESLDFAAKFVILRPRCELGQNEKRLASFNITFSDGELVSYKQDQDGEYVFDVICEKVNPWYNYAPGTDVCCKEVAQKLIENTYEPYYQRVGRFFGETIPYIFSDEVKVNWLEYYNGWPEKTIAAAYWSLRWREDFMEMWGYDLAERLPELFYRYHGQKFSKVSMDYMQMMSATLEKNFFAPLEDWCDKHGIGLTGHLMLSGFRSVMLCGMPMQQLMHFRMPGVDTLTDAVHKVSTIRTVASVANQFDKQRVISEIYGCTGWDWPLAKHKFHGDWEFALGVNYRCQHLTHYTLAGMGKKDYPASISHHSPWWKYYNKVEDYFARLSYAMSQGRADNDVLVLCPQESLMGYFDGIHRLDKGPVYEEAYGISDRWETVIREMTDNHILFDFGDERLLGEYAAAENGCIRMGRMTYHTCLILPCDTIRSSTLDLLGKSGVKVLVMGDAPSMVDGFISDKAAAYFNDRENTVKVADTTELLKALDRRVTVRADGTEATGVWCQLRQTEKGYLLFIAPNNFDEAKKLTVSVGLPEGLKAYRLDCADGRVYNTDFTYADGLLTFEYAMLPQGSGLFMFTSESIDAEYAPAETASSVQLSSPEEFAYRLGEFNTRPLDECTYRVGGGEFSEKKSVSQAQMEILDRYGLPQKKFYSYPQPWSLFHDGYADMKPHDPITMRFTFHITDVPDKAWLVWERDDRVNVTVNGCPIPESDGTYIDDFLFRHNVGGLLTEGENTVECSFVYVADMELENMYLVGDFGVYTRDAAGGAVSDNYTLGKLPQTLKPGKLAGQGLDFYTGSIFYKIPNTPAVSRIRVESPVCTCAALHAGGQTEVKAWGDIEFNTAKYAGEPTLELELIFGRKNLFGPLHAEVKELVEPDYFDYGSPQWHEQYVPAPNSAGKILIAK